MVDGCACCTVPRLGSVVCFDVGDDLKRVVCDEPIDGVLQISLKHTFTVLDLLFLSIVIIFNLQFSHVIVFEDSLLQAGHRCLREEAKPLYRVRFLVFQVELLNVILD